MQQHWRHLKLLQQLIFERPSDILRTTRCQQIQDNYSNEQGRCAVGVLFSMVGWKGYGNTVPLEYYKKLDKIGIDMNMRGKIQVMNDVENKSFSEIADELEKQGK